MKDLLLSKLGKLMEGLLYTYDLGEYNDEKLRDDIYELNRIALDTSADKLTEKNWKW